MPLDMYIITVFCFIENELKKFESKQGKLRQRGQNPKLYDSEVVCMEIVGEFLGIDSDKEIWSYFRSHWLSFFPNIGSRSSFTRQSANLCIIKQKLHEKTLFLLSSHEIKIHVVDGFPLPVCHFGRAHFCKTFKNEAAYGYCAAKKETYYGFKGEILIDERGLICGFTFAGANIDERNLLWDITGNINNLLIGDKGFISENLKEELKRERNINLETPLRSNMEETRSSDFLRAIFTKRKLVETVISQLCQRFKIQKIKTRDLWHFSNRFIRKILSHTIASFINIKEGKNPLNFERLVAP